MNDRRIHPTTGDYGAGPSGTFEMCDVLENKIALSNTIRLGSWEGDPLLGNRYDELVQDTDEQLERLRDFVREAVRWLVDTGELERVEVEVGRYEPGTFFYQADYYAPGRAEPVVSTKQLVTVGVD